MADPLAALNRRMARRPLAAEPNLPSPDLAMGVPPAFTAPTPRVPAADVAASPSVDLKSVLAQLEPKAQDETVGRAVARALQGFSRGMAATPQGSYTNPVAGGIAGGLAATGQAFADEESARIRADEPRRKVVQAILETQAGEAVKDPYRQAQESREQAGRLKLQEDRFARTKAMLADRAAQGAKDHGISVTDYLKLQEDAGTELLMQNVTPDTPGYEALLDQAVRAKAAKAKALGARGVTIPAPPAAPRPKPRTAAEYLGGR